MLYPGAVDTWLFFHPLMLEHDPGPGHPEKPARLQAVVQEVQRNFSAGISWKRPRPASREAVQRVHLPAYLDRLETLRGQRALLDLDTPLSPPSVEAAWLAAGAGVEAAEALHAGEARRAFCLLRPPGHHAEPGRGMGFCLINNLAVAAAHALATGAFERILVVDWDVHHGNGTQSAFLDRPEVLVFNTHQHPLYPGTGWATECGAGPGEGRTLNVPLPAGMGDADYALIYREVLEPVAEQFRPDLVLVSAGFDPHRNDPLGGMKVTDEGFAVLCGCVKQIADRHALGRLILFLEGGYDLRALARGAANCVGVLNGATPPPWPSGPSPAAQSIVQETRGIHARFWSL